MSTAGSARAQRGKARIADIAVQAMREAGEDRVAFGDKVLDEIAGRAGIDTRYRAHAWGKVLDALERTPDLFEKRVAYGYDSRGLSRRMRLFVVRVPAGGVT